MKRKGNFLVIILVTLIAICGNVVVSPQCVRAEISGLVALYSFDEIYEIKALDSSGNNHHGIITMASRMEGKIGDGLLFGAENARVSVDDVLCFNNGLIAIEAWIKPDRVENGETYRIIGGYNYHGFYFQIRGGRLEILYDGQSYHYGTTQIPVDVWTHIAFTSDGRNISTHINTVVDKTSNITLPVWDIANINIGANEIYTGGSPLIDYVEEFPGIMDELKILGPNTSVTCGFPWPMFIPAITGAGR